MRADYVANVAVFRGAAGEDEGQVFADAFDGIVVCGAGGDDVGAVGWEGGGWDAGESAVCGFVSCCCGNN